MKKRFLLLFTVILLLATGVLVGCGGGATTPGETTTVTTATSTGYRLHHTSSDGEYLLSWDTIIENCPELVGLTKVQAFVRRGQTVMLTSDEQVSLGNDSPAAWGYTRIVKTGDATDIQRTFAVEIIYFDTPDNLNDYLYAVVSGGFILTTDGDFVSGKTTTHTATESAQTLIAGRQFAFSITETAPAGESLLCSVNETDALGPIFRANLNGIEYAPLPTYIPARTP